MLFRIDSFLLHIPLLQEGTKSKVCKQLNTDHQGLSPFTVFMQIIGPSLCVHNRQSTKEMSGRHTKDELCRYGSLLSISLSYSVSCYC